MNSILASNINGGAVINQQIASVSRTQMLLSPLEFSLVEDKISSRPPPGKQLIKLTGKEDLSNGSLKNKTWDQNKNPVEKSINGNKSTEESIPIPKVQLFTGKIHVEWNQVHKIGAGLNNLGNTCFMNTVIQCLTYCPPLANYLLHNNDHMSKCTVTGFCMMCVLQRHMKRAIGKTGEVIRPLDVYQRLKLIAKHFQFGRQEDAHEFLRYVIDHLWKACLPQNNGISKLDAASKETTVINKIFGGYHRSQVTCLRCKKESNTYDHFMDFILDIRQNVMSLEKALEKFTQPELLQQENCYKCPKCKMKVEAQKRFSVYWAPTVATFQLKRFDYNRSFGGKITKQITYPEKLNLRPYMSETQGEPVLYRLNAVLVHAGPSCNSGHYYCYVKNSNGFWYIMDDQRVHQVSLNQVLNQSAYVLFYIKIENGERVPLKKCLDSKNSYVKGVVSNPPIAKVPEVSSLKAVPLGEKVSNSKPLSPPNAVISAPREKVSFRFQPAAPVHSPKGKISSPTTPGGLVPYVEDSSESSDASESNPSPSQIKRVSDGEGLKNGVLEGYNSSPSLEIKTKLSKSVFNHSSQNVTSNSVPKVSATSSWTVTDATETASSSSSSTCGVNSTTDWHVISTVDIKSNNSAKSSDTGATASCNLKKLQIEKLSSEQLSRVNGNHLSPSNKLTQSESSPLAQNCNFRKHTFKPHFLENQEATENSVKRKSNDSYSKISTDSPHTEGKYSPLAKKAKYAEKFVVRQNGTTDSNIETFNKGTAERRQFSASRCDSGSRTYNVNSPHSDMPHHRNFSSSHTLERGESSFSKGKHKEKNGYFESSKSLQNEITKSPMSNQERNTSLYGTEVPTWREENEYRPSIIPSHEHRRSFDDYDNELDRGKVRKFKHKDKYQYFHRNNPFQKHAEQYHNKYNGKFYNNQHNHRKSYDSRYTWKSNRNDGYHRYRNHHQRRY